MTVKILMMECGVERGVESRRGVDDPSV